MLSWRLQTGSEKAELQELNARLYDYVCRVRELERENLLLEEELRSRLSREDLWIEDQARFAEEARSLRQQLDELSWSTALAEGERDALRRELRELQREGAEASSARSRLDAELGAQRRELEEALGARAALEALLGQLEAERRDLEAVHERQVRELRARAASLTMHFRARAPGPAAPPPRLRDVHDSYALLVAESWRESVQLYEDEVRELEQALLRGQESRRQAEDEARLCAQEADALRNQALELEQLRARLEDELLRMQEEYGMQAEERQVRGQGPRPFPIALSRHPPRVPSGRAVGFPGPAGGSTPPREAYTASSFAIYKTTEFWHVASLRIRVWCSDPSIRGLMSCDRSRWIAGTCHMTSLLDTDVSRHILTNDPASSDFFFSFLFPGLARSNSLKSRTQPRFQTQVAYWEVPRHCQVLTWRPPTLLGLQVPL